MTMLKRLIWLPGDLTKIIYNYKRMKVDSPPLFCCALPHWLKLFAVIDAAALYYATADVLMQLQIVCASSSPLRSLQRAHCLQASTAGAYWTHAVTVSN